MNVTDILNQPWAITPEKLEAMCAVYERHAAGVSLDAAAIKAAIGDTRGSSSGEAPYTVQNGVAIIPVEGVLAKKMNLFTAISGGASTQMLTDAVNTAIADPLVHSLVLDIDSPGGEVDGTVQIADAVASSPKPTAAWVDGLGCSAAMWIAAQCDIIYAASPTTEVGSISVVMTHTDRSKANESKGLKLTHITTGKYKRMLSGDAPLSQDGLAYGQGKLDFLHTMFVDAVASGRGLSADQVQSTMAEGQTFYAQQAIDIGLIDGIASLDDVIQSLVGDHVAQVSNPGAAASASRTTTKAGAPSMTPFRTFATEADFNAVLTAEFERGQTTAVAAGACDCSCAGCMDHSGNKGNKAMGIDAARVAGATAERERIQAVQSQSLAGHEQIIAKLAFDGKTTGPEAAVAVLAAEKGTRTSIAAAQIADAPQVIPPTEASVTAEARRDAAAVAAKSGAKTELDPQVLARKIGAHMVAEKAAGNKISYSQAAAAVEAEHAAAK